MQPGTQNAYTIKSAASSLYMTVQNGSSAVGTPIVQEPFAYGSSSQYFTSVAAS